MAEERRRARRIFGAPEAVAGSVPSDTARFVVVRHGETAFNRDGRWQGSGSDPPLLDVGRDHARAVAAELAGVPFDALYTSDLDRAHETARILGGALKLEPRLHEGLRELSHGAWEGKTKAEILDTWPDEWSAFEADPWGVRRPDGDAYRDLSMRLWPALEELAERHRGQRVLLITHGGPMRLVLSELLGRPLTERDRWGVDNATWFVMENAAGRWRLAPAL